MKTFAIDNTGTVLLGNGTQSVKYNSVDTVVEAGEAVNYPIIEFTRTATATRGQAQLEVY